MSFTVLPNGRNYFTTDAGLPAVGYKVYTYVAGTSTQKATYTDYTGGVANTNPIITDSRGEAAIYWTGTTDVTLKTAADVLVWGPERVVEPASNAALLAYEASLSAPGGSALVGFLQSGTGAVARTVQDKERDILSVFDFLTAAQVADVVSRAFTLDVSTAVQAAITTAGSKLLYFPAGLYRLNSGVTTSPSNSINWAGAGKTATELRGNGTITVLVRIGDGTPGVANGTAQCIRGQMRDMCVSGENATVQYGIYGQRVEEHDFSRIWVRSCTVANASIGFGYVNNYYQCEFSYGTGDGLVLNKDWGEGNNANHLTGCLLFSNDGWGLKAIGAGAGLYINGGTIEQNKKGGIFTNVMRSIHCTAYFEQNALNGHTFTTPAVTVKADVVLCGSGVDTDMSNAFPTTSCVFEGCTTDPRATSNAFIWNAGVNDLTVSNCRTVSPGNVPVVAEHYNLAYKGQSVRIDRCSTFTTQLSVTNAASGLNNTNIAYYTIDDPATRGLIHRNYAQTDFNQWALISGGTATSYRRSTSSSKYKLFGTDIWEFSSTASGTGDVDGFSIDAALYPELNGKLVWYGLWVWCNDVDCYLLPYCDQQTFNNNPTALGVWTLLAVSFVWPASGTMNFGAGKRGANTGSVYAAAPMLTVAGNPHDLAIGLIPKSRQWMGSAAPTVGTWERSDIVWNTATAAAGVPGWVCTAAGTPGTWKAMAAVAA